MDPATKVSFDSPLLRIYEDGRLERLFGTETTPPGLDAATGVTSKDVVIDGTTGVFARLYIPTDLLPSSNTQRKDGAPSLQKLACRKLLVCSAGQDYARPRAAAYYEAVKASGWRGTVEWLESAGEEHVFFLGKPECDESLKLMERIVAFLAGN